MRQSGTHSLEIDEIDPVIKQQDILRLKIAVNQAPRVRSKPLRKTLECRIGPEPLDFVWGYLKIASQAVFQAILLFPSVQWLVKPALQPKRFADLRIRIVQNDNLVQRLLVQATSNRPRLGSVVPEVLLTQVLHPDQTLLRV